MNSEISCAFLGPSGTFTEQALLDLIDARLIPQQLDSHTGNARDDIQTVAADSPKDALAKVRSGEVTYACIAIENSVDGPVTPAFDALTEGSELQIFRETEIGIVFSILVRPGTKASDVRTFVTHPVAYPQVRSWVEANLPGVEVFQAKSNAAAAHQVAQGQYDACAAPARAGQLLKLEALAESVADVRGATTRFVLVGKPAVPTARTGSDRTSVSFTLPNAPGSLMRAMNEFAVRQVNLTRIESRPTRQVMGAYRFHLEFDGHIDDSQVAHALAALHDQAHDVRFLGSWPAAHSQAGGSAPPDISASMAWVDRLQQGAR